MCAEEVAERALARREARQSRKEREDPQPVAQRDVAVAKERQHAIGDRRHPPALVDHGEAQRQPADSAEAPDPLEEAEISREAAEGDVLAVVWRRFRIALAPRKRLDRPTERRAGFEQRHLVPCVRELERRREPGQAAADHDRPHLRSPEPTMRSFWSGERPGGPPKTSNSAASIRSRVAR